MKELEYVLRNHAARYPAMEPTDAVKLIYQNEFGGGHLIRDREAARNNLLREYDTVKKDPSAMLYEEIGNGVIRVNLSAMKADRLDALLDAFIISAEVHKGDLLRFRSKLDILRELTTEGTFYFTSEALESYLKAYETAGFPAVSHSGQYREAYHPAYRIICREHMFSL